MSPDITGLLFQAAYSSQWFFEVAHHLNEQCAGLTLDLVKCFNAINRQRGIVPFWPDSVCLWKLFGCGPCRSTGFHVVGKSVVSARIWLPVALAFHKGMPSLSWLCLGLHNVGLWLAISKFWNLHCFSPMRITGPGQSSVPILEVTTQWTRVVGLQIDWSKTWWWATHNSLARSVQAALSSSVPPGDHLCLGCFRSWLSAPVRD